MQKSIPPDPWDGVFHATKFGPRCCQKIQPAIFAPLDRFKYGSLSEDCLRLNVFAPAWVTQGQQFFPVLVFIHGGGYVSDSSVKYGDIGIARHLVLFYFLEGGIFCFRIFIQVCQQIILVNPLSANNFLIPKGI